MRKLIVTICLLTLFCTTMTVSGADKVQKQILKYPVSGCFHDGMAKAFRTNSAGYWQVGGFVNTKGEWLITNNGNTYDFQEGLACDSSSSDKINYINKKGKVVFTLNKKYLPTSDFFCEGRLIVRLKDNLRAVGAVDKTGKLVIPCGYWKINEFSNGYAVAAKNKKMGLIDTNGKVVIPFVYEYGYAMAGGFAFTKGSNFWDICEKPVWWFYLNHPTYDIYDAHANLIKTDISDPINMDNGVIITNDPNYVYLDNNELKQNQYKLINTSGQVLYTAPDGKQIYYLGRGRYALQEFYFTSQLMDSSGKLISNKKYGFISDFSGNYTFVKDQNTKEGKYGIIDINGNEIVPCIYDIPSGDAFLNPIIEDNHAILIDPKTKKSILFTLPAKPDGV